MVYVDVQILFVSFASGDMCRTSFLGWKMFEMKAPYFPRSREFSKDNI